MSDRFNNLPTSIAPNKLGAVIIAAVKLSEAVYQEQNNSARILSVLELAEISSKLIAQRNMPASGVIYNASK